MRLPTPPLLLITDRRQARIAIEAISVAAVRGGCRWISLREKDLPAAAQARLFARLALLLRPRGVLMMLHGPAKLARSAGADGVHLPAGASAGAARELLGADALIGVSTHSEGEAEQAARDGADYVTLSPIFASASKPGHGPAIGAEGLRAVAAAVDIPVLALGGVDATRFSMCRETGAAGAAVMGSIMRAADPEAAVRAILAS